MIDKFHTIKELKDTGLEMFNANVASDTKIGQKFLQPEVISQWDFSDYSDFFTYCDGDIAFIVNLCVKTDDKTTRYEHLKKDFSNLIK